MLRRMSMNKIVFLKLLIVFITFLIFLTLGGIVYALVNYKTTPKLFSRSKSPAVISAPEKIETKKSPETYLGLNKDEYIEDSHSCANMLCLRIKSDFSGNKIIIFDPQALKIKAVLIAEQPKNADKK